MSIGPDRPRQLPLDLAHQPGFSRDELVVSPSNQAAVSLIDRWPDWPANLMVIAGPPGSGKSHLASIWARKADAFAIDTSDPHAIAAAAPLGLNLLIDGIGEAQIDENALFHAINATRAAEKHLLITSRSWPTQWNLKLPDLLSRIKSAPMVEIAEPDDDLLSGVIVKLFADRQIDVEPMVVRFLVSRIERSLDTAQDVVTRIDHAALESKGKITRQMAASVLTEMDLGQRSLDL
jgi:chromosomal replication initiation ATPase DnaA